MALHVHRSERADRLADALAGLLAGPVDDPMAAEVVSVPTRGVERWLTQRLSATLGASPGSADGICANIEFPFPGRLVDAALEGAAGVEAGTDAWRPDHLVWPLLEVTDACIGESWLRTLAAYIEMGPGRRFGAVRHVADLFDRYGVHRPAMLRAWATGADVDAQGRPLPADGIWQAELWRRLRAWLGTPSPAERLVAACARLGDDPTLVTLPARLSLFGLTRIPASHVDVLDALAVGREIHLFALHPSPALWADVASLRLGRGPFGRDADPTVDAARHPLLASWGRDAREMQLVLPTGHVDHHHPVDRAPGRAPEPAEAGTLLAQVQAGVRGNLTPPGPPRAPEDDQRPMLPAGDRSIQVHNCHGRARQVEVLRDTILHLLRADATLEPRDIIVMCPDIDTFAPLIHATFGARTDPVGTGPTRSDVSRATDGDTDDASRQPGQLRVRLADRSIRQTNPVLAVVSELLALVDARLTASQVLDLAGRDPVRRRFSLDDDDLARIEQWVAAAEIRWGLDAAHREPYGLPGLSANTWKAGMDRLLLGAAMTEDGHPVVGGVLPVDDVGSGDLDLVGRFAELVHRLGDAVAALGRAQILTDWTATITEAAASLTATSEADDWQVTELRRLLDDVVAEAGTDRRGALLLLPAEARTLLADRLRGRPTRANFRTGHLTVCTLVPMRSVPHRVVCLLGIDDGAFPRQGGVDGDDLIERAPYVGDRDGRGEDRQLLLDALLAATECLVVTYSGRDERTNARRPPAVPLGELLDVADATCRVQDRRPDGRPAEVRDRIVTVHPLQPFDPRNFAPGALDSTGGDPAEVGPWSFDPVYLEGARALLADRAQVAPFLTSPLPALPAAPIELDALIRFLRHPVQAFLRHRLGIVLSDRSGDPDDGLPVELDGLERWQIGDRMLTARLAGATVDACRAAELARGGLPPGGLGRSVLDAVVPVVERLVSEGRRHPPVPVPPTSLDVAVDLGNGHTIAGTVSDIVGETARVITFSRVASDKRLAGWVRLLALAATRPEIPYMAVTIGQSKRKLSIATFGPLPGSPTERHSYALDQLRILTDLYRQGMTQPLPLYCETSAAWAAAAHAGKDPHAAAVREWKTTPPLFDHEDRDAYHRLVLGGIADFDDLVAQGPHPDEAGPGWPADEPSRIGRYALRLWAGPLAHQDLVVA